MLSGCHHVGHTPPGQAARPRDGPLMDCHQKQRSHIKSPRREASASAPLAPAVVAWSAGGTDGRSRGKQVLLRDGIQKLPSWRAAEAGLGHWTAVPVTLTTPRMRLGAELPQRERAGCRPRQWGSVAHAPAAADLPGSRAVLPHPRGRRAGFPKPNPLAAASSGFCEGRPQRQLKTRSTGL